MVDYGRSEKVPVSALRTGPPDLRGLAPGALRCKLDNKVGIYIINYPPSMMNCL